MVLGTLYGTEPWNSRKTVEIYAWEAACGAQPTLPAKQPMRLGITAEYCCSSTELSDKPKRYTTGLSGISV